MRHAETIRQGFAGKMGNREQMLTVVGAGSTFAGWRLPLPPGALENALFGFSPG
jgi:hypothetical protein